MSTDQKERNKQAYHHFHDAINSGDLEVIGKAIDEFIRPGGRFHYARVVDLSVWELVGTRNNFWTCGSNFAERP